MNALIDFHSNNVSPNPTLSKMNRKQNHRKIKKDDKRKKENDKDKGNMDDVLSNQSKKAYEKC